MAFLSIFPGQTVATFTEGNNVTSTPVVIDPILNLFTFPLTNSLSSATVSFSGTVRSEDVLSFVNDNSTMDNITGSYNSSTGVLTLQSAGASASLNAWIFALRAVTYTDTSQTPDTTQRIVNLTVSDTFNSSAPSQHLINVISVDDSPILATSGGSTAFTEAADAASTPVKIDQSITISDLDNTTFASAVVSVDSFSAGDLLAFVNDNATMGNITGVYDTSAGVLTLTSLSATATLAQWQAALRAVTYSTTSDAPPTSRTISFKINDGTASSNTITHQISISTSNDSPHITAPPAINAFENGTFTFVAGSATQIVLSDGDIGTHAGVVSLTVTHGTLTLASTSGLSFTTGDGSNDSSMTFSGNLTDLNKALTGMTFTPTGLFSGSADLSVTFNDQGFSGAGGAKSASYNLPINVVQTVPNVSDVSSISGSGTYAPGQTITLRVIFDLPVTVLGTPTLTLETGAADRAATFIGGSTTNVLLFDYTVQPGDVSSDLDYVSTTALSLNGGTIKSVKGVDATLTLPTVGGPHSIAGQYAFVVGSGAPVVTDVTSSNADGTYHTGDVIQIGVTFSSNVTVSGLPSLTLETGTIDENAVYTSGSGTNRLNFAYTVRSGDTTGDLDYIATTALLLNGGSIKDATGNSAVLALPALGSAHSIAGQKSIVVSNVATPTVTDVTSTSPNGTYTTGNLVNVRVTFDQAVTLDMSSGFPTLLLETGGIDRTATYVSGSGTSTLVFSYTVQAGDTSSDLDYASSAALTLNGATLKNSSGANAALSLPAPGTAHSIGGQKDIVVNTSGPGAPTGTAPVVVDVTAQNSDGTYKIGDTLLLNVSFDHAVSVNTAGGTPSLWLATGIFNRQATYVSGSGTTALVFSYVVQSGDASPDLDYISISALTLNGATISDAINLAANILLPTTGSAHSIAGQKALVIDGATAAVPKVVTTIPTPDGSSSSIIVQTPAGITPTLGTPGVDTLLYGGGGSVTLPAIVENLTITSSLDLTVTGNSLNNRVDFTSAGKATVDGGAGTDIAVFNLGLSAYTTLQTANGITINGPRGQVQLSHFETLSFADAILHLDSSAQAASIFSVYQAAFGRQPDISGETYWLKTLNAGSSLTSIAAQFSTSAEFAKLYGSNTSDAAYASALYTNTLGRAPDAAGLAYWTGVLAHGESRAQLLVDFAQSAENQATIAPVIAQGIFVGV